MTRKILVGLILGALLGVVCIIGAQIRSGFTQSTGYLFAFWYNRLMMGFVIALLPFINWKTALLRGAVIGMFISFAFYASTGFEDFTGFFAGIIYGIIIEATLYYLKKKGILS
ncbi:MAG: hypothetical protein ACOCUE_00525 [Candidatus Izemoplasmataceae bacterium]